MKDGLDRRQILKGMAGIFVAPFLGNLPSPTEAKEGSFQVFGSTLTEKELTRQRDNAVHSLKRSIPPGAQLNHLRSHAEHLQEESQMYIPMDEEIAYVISQSSAQIHELARNVKKGESGIFIFADINSQGKRTQRLYIVKRIDNDAIQFEKAYFVSTALKGFSNEDDSQRTPLGIHAVHSGKIGMFGEVVSGANEYKDRFLEMVVNGLPHWFVKGFGLEAGNDIAEVVTDQYLLQGPRTSLKRGIRIHGTNRSGELRNGKWRTFLGGRRQSGGCIRMSNADIRDLALSGYIKKQTSVMIHATPQAINATKIYE